MNIKTSLFYAALAACLGTGYGAHYLVADTAHVPPLVECQQETADDRKFKSTQPMNSAGRSYLN